MTPLLVIAGIAVPVCGFGGRAQMAPLKLLVFKGLFCCCFVQTASHQLPVGHKSQLSALRVTAVPIDSALSSQLLALSTAKSAGAVATSPIHGFVVM